MTLYKHLFSNIAYFMDIIEGNGSLWLVGMGWPSCFKLCDVHLIIYWMWIHWWQTLLTKDPKQPFIIAEIVQLCQQILQWSNYIFLFSQCPMCGRRFGTSSNMQIHIKGVHMKVRYPCNICGKGYSRTSLGRHQKMIHSSRHQTQGKNAHFVTGSDCVSSKITQIAHPLSNTDDLFGNNA